MPIARPVVHMTTVHPRTDARIRLKEVATLAGALDRDVRLLVQDGEGDEISAGGYRIVDSGPRMSRAARMTTGAARMVAEVRRSGADLVHFHDPELLPWAALLRLSGTKVIYDVHEDVPRQILHNARLHPWVRKALSPVASAAEWMAAKIFNAIVAATPEIAARFPASKTVVVRNYPLIEEFAQPGSTPMAHRERCFAYVGGLTRIRGLFAMAEALDHLGDPSVTLRLAGEFIAEDERKELETSPAAVQIRYEGWVGRGEVATLLSQARAGLVTLMPIRNYVDARPVKLFEYMAAGLPVIASDFPRWREIVDGAGCGLLVDPTDPGAIAEAMRWVLDHPEEAQDMGLRGRKAVMDHFNWAPEADRLVTLYRKLLN